jgi:hypothetical protein
MKSLLSIASWLGLLLTLAPSFLLLAGIIGRELVNGPMAIGMVLWFVARTLRESLFRPTEVSHPSVEPDSPHTL